jgi:hypothetical protein
MSVMSGLAGYEIFKTGAFLLLMTCILFCVVGLLISNINKNYVSTTICNIVSNPITPISNHEQTLTYSVNGKQYVKIIPGISTTANNIKTINYAYQEGSCTLYYASANPDDYSITYNPTTMSGIGAGILLFVIILIYLWLSFLRSNRDVAGVFGGISAAKSVIGSFKQ